jgi:crossover junction endodeoxyribonuclease RuvC
MRILGLDPGLRRTGWGVIEIEGTRLKHVANGTVGSDSARALAERLVQLHDAISAIIAEMRPGEAAVEQTFVSKDAAGTLKLGQARAIALLVPAQAGISVAEYAPNMVKKSVVGVGHAEKEQIRAMVKVLLPTCELDSDDAADALAVAITHAHHRQTTALAASLKVRV